MILTLAALSALSLLFNGGFNRSEMGPENITNTFSLNGGLSLQLGNLVKIGQINLALNGLYSRIQNVGSTLSDYRVYVKVDFSF